LETLSRSQLGFAEAWRDLIGVGKAVSVEDLPISGEFATERRDAAVGFLSEKDRLRAASCISVRANMSSLGVHSLA
jgi:hypothetical protein